MKEGDLKTKGREFSLGESNVAFSFYPTWLVLAVGTPNNRPRIGL